MPRKTLPFVGGFADPNIQGIDYSIPINMKATFYEGVGDNFLAMEPSPGHARFFDLPSGVTTTADNVRGLYVMDGNIYGVFGNKLVELLPTIVGGELTGFSESELGTLSTDTGPVQMVASNNNELAIADGSSLYSYIAAATVSFVEVSAITFNAQAGPGQGIGTGASFQDINDIDFFDNRFIFTRRNTNVFYISTDVPFTVTTADNPTAATDGELTRLREGLLGGDARYRRAALTARADTLKGIIVNNLSFFLIGNRVTEQWTDAGVAGIPFRRINQQVTDVGAASTASIAQATGNNGFDFTVMLTTDIRGGLDVMVFGGRQPQSIANRAIQGLLRDQVREPQNAIGFLFREQNELYYQLTFPGDDNLTIVYDFERQQWHRLTDQAGNRHRANCYVHFNLESFKGGFNFIGDYESRYIYQYSSDIYTEANGSATTYKAGTILDGERLPIDTSVENTALAIPKTYFAPWLRSPEERKVRVSRVELNCVQGLGRTDYTQLPTKDKNPKIYLSASRDKGRTFEDAHADGIGIVGFYKERTRYNRFGHSHDGWVFRVQSYSKQPIIILSMIVDFDVGNE